MVERAKRHSTGENHATLFTADVPSGVEAKTLDELKQGSRQRMQRRHARR